MPMGAPRTCCESSTPRRNGMPESIDPITPKGTAGPRGTGSAVPPSTRGTAPHDGPALMPLSVHELGSAATGSYHDPHSVLGAHSYEGAVTVRTLKPFAHAVEVLTPDGEAHPMVHEYDGIWAVALDRPGLPSYLLRVTWTEGEEPVTLEAPYRFLPTLRSEEHTSELQSRGQLVCSLLLENKEITT